MPAAIRIVSFASRALALRPWRAGAAAILVLAGCGGGAKPTVPELKAWVGVLTATTGEEAPATLSVAVGDVHRSVASNGVVVVELAAAGSYTVRLGGIPRYCEPAGPVERQVSAVLNDTVDVSFELQCPTAGPDRLVILDGGNIYSMTEYATRLVQLTTTPQNYFAAVSPDGSKIAFTSNRDGDDEIYVMNADGSNQRNLTRSPATRDSWPKWSPDGSRIVFYSWHTASGPASAEIFVMDADGGSLTQLTSNSALDADPEWSPDGTRIVFMSERDGNQEIYVMNADGSSVVRLTNEPGLDGTPTWSPDGSLIAFSTTRFAPAGVDAYDVAVMNSDGTGFRRLTDHPEIDVNPVWSPDGRRLVYNHRVRVGDYDIWMIDSDGTNTRPVLQAPGNQQAHAWRVLRR